MRDKANDRGIVIVSAGVAWPGMMSNCEQQTLNGSGQPLLYNPLITMLQLVTVNIYHKVDLDVETFEFFETVTIKVSIEYSRTWEASGGTEVPARANFFLL